MATSTTFDELLRLPPGKVDLQSIDTRGKPGFDGDKDAGEGALHELGPELANLQERLYSERTTGSTRNLLLVLQGMDTSGKGGVLKVTVGLMDPVGVMITSFKAPTDEEKQHDFLWRIEKAVPGPGMIGVFDRSHYEDVLIARLHGLADPGEIERRYGAINDFEQRLVDGGTTIVKCMLHISPEEQKERLLARLDDPAKRWKYNPRDLDERARWADYREAYEIALERTNTDAAPWHVVPSDSRWFRNLVIGHLLVERLRGLDLTWPTVDFDVDVEKKRLADEAPLS